MSYASTDALRPIAAYLLVGLFGVGAKKFLEAMLILEWVASPI